MPKRAGHCRQLLKGPPLEYFTCAPCTIQAGFCNSYHPGNQSVDFSLSPHTLLSVAY